MSIDGKFPTAVDLPMAAFGAFSADAKQLAYDPDPPAFAGLEAVPWWSQQQDLDRPSDRRAGR
jgi:hypothetical protein